MSFHPEQVSIVARLTVVSAAEQARRPTRRKRSSDMLIAEEGLCQANDGEFEHLARQVAPRAFLAREQQARCGDLRDVLARAGRGEFPSSF